MTTKKSTPKTTKSAKTKRRTTAKRRKLPERNIFMERMIIVCALMAIVSLFMLVPTFLIIVAFAALGGPAVAVFMGLFIGFLFFSPLIQAFIVLWEWQRVDRYGERLGVLLMMTIVPIIIGISTVVQMIAVAMGLEGGQFINLIALGLTYPFGIITGFLGTLYMWTLLLSKKKLFWQYAK